MWLQQRPELTLEILVTLLAPYNSATRHKPLAVQLPALDKGAQNWRISLVLAREIATVYLLPPTPIPQVAGALFASFLGIDLAVPMTADALQDTGRHCPFSILPSPLNPESQGLDPCKLPLRIFILWSLNRQWRKITGVLRD